MNKYFQESLLKATGAQAFHELEHIQQLWSGYGSIVRYALDGANTKQVVVKHVKLPEGSNHPRGWNTDISHERKVKSYKVEMEFYSQYASSCNNDCRLPKCYTLEKYGDEVLMVFEDLDASGYYERKSSVTLNEMKRCLSWLAYFHATFMNHQPKGLWESGTYWHLATRPDELKALNDQPLKKAAAKIDQLLNESPYQTLVHGDAKLANFCFDPLNKRVAAVDFQYVGGGCGMKDVAYFIGSCLYEDDCERYEEELLNAYFKALKKALTEKQPHIDPEAIVTDWRQLYPVAWTDFHRFIKGWSPGHWKINSYSERLAQEVISKLR